MSIDLPPAVQRKLDHTLGQWQHWQCEQPLPGAPQAQRVLGGGVSNYSILVGTQRQWVVRIDGINPLQHGLNRQAEWSALREASRHSLAPCPRYFNPDLGSLVCDYLPPDGATPATTAQLADLLRRIHALPPRHHRLDLAERIQRYENRVSGRTGAAVQSLTLHAQAVADLVQQVRDTDQTRALCHNDLLRTNRIVSGGRLLALDWEYCAMGSTWYELAVITQGDALPARERDDLLRAYLQREPLPQERHLLLQYECIYGYLELLWYLAQGEGEPQGTAFDAKLRLLRDKLAGAC